MRNWKKNRVEVELVAEIEVARLAAYIDGEGCLLLTPSGGARRHEYSMIRVCIAQADLRLMEWLLATFGGRYDMGGGGTNRPMYYWLTESAYACRLLKRCLPYLIVKKDQAEVLLEYFQTITENNRRTLPESVAERRKSLKTKLTLLKHPEKNTA